MLALIKSKLISDKVDFRGREIIRSEARHYIVLEGSIFRDIRSFNLMAKSDDSTIIVGGFTIP